MYILWCIIIYLGILLGKDNCEEPECSRFQYDEKMLEKIIRFEIGMDTMRQEMKQLQKVVNDGLNLLQTERIQFKKDINAMKQGYIAGKAYNADGNGSDNVCLPAEPAWSNYTDGNDGCCIAHIYGTEVDIKEPSNIFLYRVNQQDLPCAVCKSKASSTLMVPAHNECYPGWTHEYGGYLMAGVNGHKGSHNHICMDMQPEFLHNGAGNNNQHILYLVETQCGSLPCLPYVQGCELACAVCSKQGIHIKVRVCSAALQCIALSIVTCLSVRFFFA